MTGRERIFAQIRGEKVDRVPLVGGWVLGARNIAEIAGISAADYSVDPLGGVLSANRILGCDALVPPLVPDSGENERNHHGREILEEDFSGITAESLLEYADTIPETEAGVLSAKFDACTEELRIQAVYRAHMVRTRGFPLIPNDWGVSANWTLFAIYGYRAFLEAIALYPDAVEKIFWESAVLARHTNEFHIRMIRELGLPPILFTGHDICSQTGPMCSPRFLRKHYWPHAKYALEPFVDAGIRLIHHCDGNVMPIVDDIINAGYSGFQGFQYECGVDPYEIARRRGPNGERLLFLGGLSVTRTLPFGTLEDVRREVDYCIDYTDGGHGLFLFTSNVVVVETPMQNLREAYRYAITIDL